MYLKSSLDRFIDSVEDVGEQIGLNLKSSLDRFIGAENN